MYKALVTIKVDYRNGESEEKTLEFFIYDCKSASDAVRMAQDSVVETDQFKSMAEDFNKLGVDLRLIKLGRTDEGVFFIPS